MSFWFGPKRCLVLVVLAAWAVHTAFLGVLPERLRVNESADYRSFYEPVARNGLAGKGWITPEDEPAVRYPPGHPLLLAAVFWASEMTGMPESAALHLFIALAVALYCGLLYAIAERVVGAKTALIATALWITYPVQLWLAKQPNSELPFLVVLFAGIYQLMVALDRQRPVWWQGLAIGACIGGASLIRPITIGISVVLIAGLWLWPNRWTHRMRAIFCLLMVAGNLVVIAPWELWAHARTGEWIPLSSGGVFGLVDGLVIGVRPSSADKVLPVSEDVRDVMQSVLDNENEFESPGDVVRFMAATFASKPVPVVKIFLLKVARAWYATDSQRYEKPLALLQAPYLLLALAGLVLAWRSRGRRRAASQFTLLLVLYFWFMAMLALTMLRYMTPVMALLMIFAALPLGKILRVRPEEGLESVDGNPAIQPDSA